MTRIQVRLPLGPQPGLNSKSWGPFSTSRPLSSFPTSSPGRAPCSFSLFSILRLAPRPPEDPKALSLRAPPLDSCTPPHSLQPTVRTQAAQECRAASLLPLPKAPVELTAQASRWTPDGSTQHSRHAQPRAACCPSPRSACLDMTDYLTKVLTECGSLFVPTGEGWGGGATPGTLSPQQCPPVPGQDRTSAQGLAHQPFSQGPGANSPWGKVGCGTQPPGQLRPASVLVPGLGSGLCPDPLPSGSRSFPAWSLTFKASSLH